MRQAVLPFILVTSAVSGDDLSRDILDLQELQKLLGKWHISSVRSVSSPCGWQKTRGGNGLRVTISGGTVSIEQMSIMGGKRIAFWYPRFTFCIMPSDFSGKSANGAVFDRGEMDSSAPQSAKAMLIMGRFMTVKGFHIFYEETYSRDWGGTDKFFDAILK